MPLQKNQEIIAFNTPAIFFLEFLILGMMRLSWLETLRDGNPFYFSYTKLSYLGKHSEVGQVR